MDIFFIFIINNFCKFLIKLNKLDKYNNEFNPLFFVVNIFLLY